ncbi:VOC family protein [bacterium]|nr:VOC family protein [bacterium]
MTSIEWAEIRVRDLDLQERFYRDLFGWEPTFRSPGQVHLGPLRLLEDDQARIPGQAQPGLFHLAYLAPNAEALGGWLQHAAGRGVRLEGASDHGVSQALYLSDPEGNGIEVYADRPRQEWPGAPGAVEMFTRRLDLEGLLAKAHPWSGPAGFRLGHIHLRALDPYQGAEWFEGLGMRVTVHYPGAEFYAADGYHHHFAVNNWGVEPAAEGLWVGLNGYALRGSFHSEVRLDPWGHRVELISA